MWELPLAYAGVHAGGYTREGYRMSRVRPDVVRTGDRTEVLVRGPARKAGVHSQAKNKPMVCPQDGLHKGGKAEHSQPLAMQVGGFPVTWSMNVHTWGLC